MFKRFLIHNLKAALKDTPIIFLKGARQTGKSTLVQMLQTEEKNSEILYLTLDDLTTLNAAKLDPCAFLNRPNKRIIIDEIQRAPELFLPLKLEVDRNPVPGRFILTGSADIFLLPQLADSLAGRLELLSLHPLSLGELNNQKETFIQDLFENNPSKLLNLRFSKQLIGSKDQFIDHILKGGFPSIQSRASHQRRGAWFNSYITTLIERDIRELANIEGLSRIPNLLKFLATRSACLLNFEEIGRSIQLPATTLRRYFTLLQTFFLIHTLPAWLNNHGKRLTKSPKLYLSDTGIACHLLGLNAQGLTADAKVWGNLLETFIVNELIKISAWNSPWVSFYHYRTLANQEVDIVLESQDGSIVGIEIKAAQTLTPRDFKGLKDLQETAGSKFICGILLHLGQQASPFGKNLYAIPIV